LIVLGSVLPVAHAYGKSPQKFSSTGTPSVADIDSHVEAVMKANDVHMASLAIVEGTRLVYAKGYTYGGSETPETKPTTLFRQASCSKFLTALGIMQLIEEGKLTRDTKMQDVLHLKTHGGKNPTDSRFGNVTIQELLEMRSGLQNDAPFNDVVVSKATGKALPVLVEDVEEFLANETLMNDPGNRSKAFYSNTGFSVLGYIVAKLRNKKNLAEALDDSMFKPLGITRIRASESLKGSQKPDEATYYANPYQTRASVMTPPQPQVELEYGDENLQNFEGGGGLSAAAVDYARILAALNEPSDTIIFKKASTYTQMLKWSAECYKDKRFASGAFGFYGLDYCAEMASDPGSYEADKGGYLETSQNAIYFQTGGLAYVICWDGHTPNGEAWYPSFDSVIEAAQKHDWKDADHFPDYGMKPLPSVSKPRMILRKATVPGRGIDEVLGHPKRGS
jgi:CubicO group peptidase (beta-lactamase class C family)